MLSVLLGLTFSVHLMTYQAGMDHLDQTLIASDLNPSKVVYVEWSYHV